MQRDEHAQQAVDQPLPPSPVAALVLLGVTAFPLGTTDEGILEMSVKYQSCHSAIQLLTPWVTAG